MNKYTITYRLIDDDTITEFNQSGTYAMTFEEDTSGRDGAMSAIDQWTSRFNPDGDYTHAYIPLTIITHHDRDDYMFGTVCMAHTVDDITVIK